MEAYPRSERSRVRRLHERGSHERAAVHAVLDAGHVAHVGYVIDDQPFVTPTAHWRDGDRVYWHGSAASRMLKTTAAGIPVCLTVTHLDGFVLARSGFHHSINYRSAMLFGRAHEVTEPAAKRAALDAFIDRLFPGRAAELRAPTAQELKATRVLVMAIEEATAKVRTGPPKDDAADLDAPVWAGVLPVRTVLVTPEPDPAQPPARPIPAYLRGAGAD